MIAYKARSVGIDFKSIDESYTSQTCPVCGHRNKTNNRNYNCSQCGFKYHRDGVGAINIYRKYTAGTLKGGKPDWLEGVLTLLALQFKNAMLSQHDHFRLGLALWSQI